MDRYLEVKASTWLRDSQELFDYDTSNLQHEVLKLSDSGYIIRRGNAVSYQAEPASPSETRLLRIVESEEEYLICPLKEDHIGLVIKDCKFQESNGYRLVPGDLLKLGKVVLRIKQTSEVPCEPDSIDECEGSNNSDVTCRICFRTHSNRVDPLLSLCHCSGTMALTHLRCLQKWAMSRSVQKVNTHSISYLWKSLECDICRLDLPLNFVFEGGMYSLIHIPVNKDRYLMFEDFRREKYKCVVHLVYPDVAPVMIGRSPDCDLKINDVSVSRSHATIQCQGKHFFITDNSSKFGTLVLARKPISVTPGSSVVVQVNRTRFVFSMKRTNTISRCLECCRSGASVEPIPKGRTEIPIEEQSLRSHMSQFNE